MRTRGISLIEILLVLFLISLLTAIGVGMYSSSQVNADFRVQRDSVVSYLRLAQSKARSGFNDTDHGVYFGVSSYTLFEGSVYDELSDSNFVVELPGTMVIENISLNGGGSSVVFEGPNGETSDYGTLEINAADFNKSATIRIEQEGVIRLL